MTRAVILTVLVLAALCQVYGAQQKPAYKPLLQEVHQALFKRRTNQLRSENHYWCYDVLEQHRESICYVPPPVTQAPQPTHDHHTTDSWQTKPHNTKPHQTKPPQTKPPHIATTHEPHTEDHTHAPNTTHSPDDGHNHTALFAEFVRAEEAKGFLGKAIQDLHEECCYESCDVEEIVESCWYSYEE